MVDLLIVVFLIIIMYVITHLHPLNEKEVLKLADKRRNRAIKKYYKYTTKEKSVDKGFKKGMKSTGAYYLINEDLSLFPSIAAGLLKYKKHEWTIVAFEKNKTIQLMWTNKGINNKTVSIFLSTEQIIAKCKDNNYSTVLIFHNHPNSDPHTLDCSRPSAQDINSAQIFSNDFNKYGINLIEFVCERGLPYEYHFSESETFLPTTEFIQNINQINGMSKIQNVSLHTEKLF